MENQSYSDSSYSDSRTSTPRSREIDCNNRSWNEPKVVKLMCSYGGKIQPRPHDNKLSYIGGDTKILTVDRNIGFGDFVARLSSLCGFKVCFKYQLPGEDLDALISVTNDEDLEHMMLEYDRSRKPARLRLFMFAPEGLDKGGQPVEVRGGEQEGQVLSQSDIRRRLTELQRMQISEQEQVVYHQQVTDDYCTAQNIAVQQGMSVYWQDRSQMTAGGAAAEQQQQQVYIIPAPGAVYQASTNFGQTTGHVGQAHTQAFYGTQRVVVPDAYREHQVYSSVPGPVVQNFRQPTTGVYAESGYAVAYDGNGRQDYYSAAGGGVAPTYRAVSTAPAPTQFAAANQEGNVTNPNAN